MFAEERYMRIVEMINAAGKATVSELSEMLGVSSVTVRRDLEKLEEKGLLIRTHGGAIPPGNASFESTQEKSFSEKEEAYTDEKERIAQAAARLVEDGEAVLLSPGTTNMLLTRKLTVRSGLTLVTNAANIAAFAGIQDNIDVIFLGGKLRRKSYAAVGPLTEQALSQIRVDKLFLGVDGIDAAAGLTTPNLAEASINRLMISIAKEVIVVADHTKFGKVMLSHIAPLEAVHKVISDKKLPESIRRLIRDSGTEIVIADG